MLNVKRNEYKDVLLLTPGFNKKSIVSIKSIRPSSKNKLKEQKSKSSLSKARAEKEPDFWHGIYKYKMASV